MAAAYVYRTTETPERYNPMAEEVFASGSPQGLILHAAGTGDDGVLTIIEVWETDEAADRFGQEVIMPAFARHNIDPSGSTRTRIDLENVVGPAATLVNA